MIMFMSEESKINHYVFRIKPNGNFMKRYVPYEEQPMCIDCFEIQHPGCERLAPGAVGGDIEYHRGDEFWSGYLTDEKCYFCMGAECYYFGLCILEDATIVYDDSGQISITDTYLCVGCLSDMKPGLVPIDSTTFGTQENFKIGQTLYLGYMGVSAKCAICKEIGADRWGICP